jgi:hypothetical protein
MSLVDPLSPGSCHLRADPYHSTGAGPDALVPSGVYGGCMFPLSPTRNWLGPLAVALAAISVGSYWAGVVLNNQAMANPTGPPNELSALGLNVSILAAAASAAIGIAAVVRARRGSGGLVIAIVGLLLGGGITSLFAIWFLGLVLNPGALG